MMTSRHNQVTVPSILGALAPNSGMIYKSSDTDSNLLAYAISQFPIQFLTLVGLNFVGAHVIVQRGV